jgi:hypothetical protein
MIFMFLIALLGGSAHARQKCTEAQKTSCSCKRGYSCYVYSDGSGCGTADGVEPRIYMPCGKSTTANSGTSTLQK